MFGAPGGIGQLILETAAGSVNENRVRFQGAQAAGLFEGENTFQPAVAPEGKLGKNGKSLKFSRDLDSDWVIKNSK